jgi:hypothetical protein
MPIRDWLHQYPHVQALQQQDGEPLAYWPDGEHAILAAWSEQGRD